MRGLLAMTVVTAMLSTACTATATEADQDAGTFPGTGGTTVDTEDRAFADDGSEEADVSPTGADVFGFVVQLVWTEDGVVIEGADGNVPIGTVFGPQGHALLLSVDPNDRGGVTLRGGEGGDVELIEPDATLEDDDQIVWVLYFDDSDTSEQLHLSLGTDSGEETTVALEALDVDTSGADISAPSSHTGGTVWVGSDGELEPVEVPLPPPEIYSTARATVIGPDVELQSDREGLSADGASVGLIRMPVGRTVTITVTDLEFEIQGEIVHVSVTGPEGGGFVGEPAVDDDGAADPTRWEVLFSSPEPGFYLLCVEGSGGQTEKVLIEFVETDEPVSGLYDVSSEVEQDSAGHEPFDPDPPRRARMTLGSLYFVDTKLGDSTAWHGLLFDPVPGSADDVLSPTHDPQNPNTVEVILADDFEHSGQFTAEGQGTVAGFSDIRVRFDGVFGEDHTFTGTISKGIDGGLPQGEPIVYSVTGSLIARQPIAFVADLARAFRDGDSEFLLDRLHPGILDLYGNACDDHTTELSSPDLTIDVHRIVDVFDWELTLDDRDLVVPSAIRLDVTRTENGTSNRTVLHIAPRFGDRPESPMTWLTDCGEPIPSEQR